MNDRVKVDSAFLFWFHAASVSSGSRLANWSRGSCCTASAEDWTQQSKRTMRASLMGPVKVQTRACSIFPSTWFYFSVPPRETCLCGAVLIALCFYRFHRRFVLASRFFGVAYLTCNTEWNNGTAARTGFLYLRIPLSEWKTTAERPAAAAKCIAPLHVNCYAIIHSSSSPPFTLPTFPRRLAPQRAFEIPKRARTRTRVRNYAGFGLRRGILMREWDSILFSSIRPFSTVN